MAASREYLAAGLDGLAELAAESEGSLDRLFAARIASERGDYRRATSILKGLHPALGTPEEGGVPLDERELFYPLTHLSILREEGRRAGLSPALLCGLIRQESLFRPGIVSRAGAVGLMQVMPATGKLLRRREGGRGRPNLTLPDENVRLGSQFFGRLLKLFDGDVVAALAAYNAGPSRAARWKKENANLPPDEWVEAIRFPETREYVKRVLFFSGAYAALYGLPDPPGTVEADHWCLWCLWDQAGCCRSGRLFSAFRWQIEQSPRIWWAWEIGWKSQRRQTSSWSSSIRGSANSITFPHPVQIRWSWCSPFRRRSYRYFSSFNRTRPTRPHSCSSSSVR